MKDAIEAHITAAEAFYRPIIHQAHDRLTGGPQLLASFAQAVTAYRKTGRRQVSGIIERVNELAVARKLLTDPQFVAAHITHEPELIPGPKFDFVLTTPNQPTHYIEVKTVSPQSANDETSWQKTTYRSRPATPRTPHDDSAAQAAFLRYTAQTESKLEAHIAIDPGDGLLIICGDGTSWPPSALSDFVASYRGPLSFGTLIRSQDAVEPSAWTYPVKGPVEVPTN